MTSKAVGLARDLGRLSLRLVPAVALFAVLEPLIRRAARLPDAAYEQPIILLALPDRLGALVTARAPLSTLGLAAGIAALTIGLARSGRARRVAAEWFAGWSAVSDGAALRALFGFALGIVAWRFSAYEYNAWAGQTHLADRTVLLGCWALVLWRPVLALPFATVLVAIAGQMDVPLGAHSWTEVELFIRIPILLGAWWLTRPLTGARDGDGLLFLLLALLAVTFWTSGLGKLRADWLAHSNLENLPAGAWAAGWLSFVDADTIGRAARIVGRLALPLVIGTLIVECGSLLALSRRWTLPAWLALAILFHLGVLALSGIFFWKWILLESALLAFLFAGRRWASISIFSGAHSVLYAALLIGAPLWMGATDLTWRQTPLTYVMRFEGIDAAGGRHTLPYDAFSPFADSFVISTFAALADHPRLTGAMGVTHDAGIATELQRAEDPASLFAIEQRLGRPRFDPEVAAEVDAFIARYARFLNETRGRAPRAPAALRPPRHLWTFPRGDVWRGASPLVRVELVEDTYFFDGRRPALVRTRRLRGIDVSGETGVRPPVDSREAARARPR